MKKKMKKLLPIILIGSLGSILQADDGDAAGILGPTLAGTAIGGIAGGGKGAGIGAATGLGIGLLTTSARRNRNRRRSDDYDYNTERRANDRTRARQRREIKRLKKEKADLQKELKKQSKNRRGR